MTLLQNIKQKIAVFRQSEKYTSFEEFALRYLAPKLQSKKAIKLWAEYEDFEEYFYGPEVNHERSRWVADQVIQKNMTSVLEVGSNAGRNLAAIRNASPDIKLKGIDINQKAIEFGKSKSPTIEFALVDGLGWYEKENSWDAVLTMSVIDHIPNESIEDFAKNLVKTTNKYLICVELWDGSNGVRGLYKYSRDLPALFEKYGVKTVVWQESVGQYNRDTSLLYAYIGEKI